jgi:hypothetical protein
VAGGSAPAVSPTSGLWGEKDVDMNQSIYDREAGQDNSAAIRAAPQDVRPILERKANSIWARVEKRRDEICDVFRRACEDLGFDALVIKSPLFVQPAWVKLECWVPKHADRREVTERGSVLVTIAAKEFHRYELEYTVELHDRGWSKTYYGLTALEPVLIAQIVRFLLVHESKPDFASLQLRSRPAEIWKPVNKVDVLRTDWLRKAPASLFVLSLFFIGGLLPLSILLWIGIGVSYYALHQRRAVVLSQGRPMTEPRTLSLVDSWQVAISGLGADAELLRQRFFTVLRNPPMTGLQSRVEKIWYWGIDGKVEREQIVLTFRRAIFFCHIYQYDQELYVGWDAHLNHGHWVEKTVGTGIHRQSNELTRINTVESGWQRLSEYDVTDANCLIEWAHAKLVQLVKHLMEERQIDQEIDFKILRGERQNLTRREQAGGGIQQASEGIQQAAQRVTRKLTRTG